jgi:dinuclear metal center YbgI/SA1388 family protein
MITLSNLKNYLDEFMLFDKTMNVEKIDPLMANGLMVKGKEEINKIGFGVSASLAFFKIAKEAGYDALVVHHSFNMPQINHYDEIFQNRIEYLLKNQISLFGYHFLLDAHPEIGNNKVILDTIGAKSTTPFLHRGNPWGWIGEYKEELEFEKMMDLFRPFLSERVKIYDFGPKKIKRVVVCSGSGAPYSGEMQELIDKKIDLFITGEGHEWNRELFREAEINFIAGGHYATEVFGVKTLMGKVSEQFPNIDSGWIDLVNDI